jgi:DNA-binding MarR family transcriptional regulator
MTSDPAPVPPADAPADADRPSYYRAEAMRPDESVGWLVKRLMQSIVLQIDRRLAVYDLTHAQWLPLYRLARGECDTIASLARDQSLDPGAMTRALDRLETKGLLNRVRSLQDRRVVNLALTDEGRRLAEVVPPVLAEVLNAHLVGFSHDEWRLLLNLLQRAVANGDVLRDATKDTP